tara:strand:+ start:1704 stop:2636 length:933 start_codon:yes stop_codon:yes gene_type:complete
MELDVADVSKQYANVLAVKQLSFKVKQGEIFALLGPNGAGKSSLIRMLTGFTQPDEGKISLNMDNQSYSSIPAYTLGYLPEDRGLYPEKSPLKNIVYFAQLNGVSKSVALQDTEYWLERFDLLERKDDPLKSLSKGNQQKIQLITAVIHRPRWVILDEPFSGLDPINQEKVVVFLSELKAKGMTVILSAHQMAMVEKLADRMLLMNKGEAVFYGSLQDIQTKANTSSVLKANFINELDKSLAKQLLSGINYQHLDALSLKLTLTTEQSLNALLPLLAQLGELQSLLSEKMDLHQLYLNAIANHGAASHVE